MFDTMTITKAVGAICSALLVLLLGNWAASSIFHIGPDGHGEEHAQAYVIDTGAVADDGGAAEVVDIEALFASADAAAGEKVFGKCKACHKIDGNDATGPHLNGVMGREIASSAGFAYSTSMAEHRGTNWDRASMDAFLLSPKAFAANTKMSFAGLPRPTERVNLIAYLETLH